MSKIINALHNIQESKEIPLKDPTPAKFLRKTKILSLKNTGTALVGVIIFLLAIILYLGNRITSEAQITQKQLSDVLSLIKSQDLKIREMTDATSRMEKASNANIQAQTENIKKLNNDVTQKVASLKEDLNSQKTAVAQVTEDQNKKLNELFETVQTGAVKQKNLQDQVGMIKEKVGMAPLDRDLY